MEIQKIVQTIQQTDSELTSVHQYLKELEILSRYAGEDEVISSKTAQDILSEEAGKVVLNINTKLPTLDNLIGGFREGQVIIISGPTGSGKTSLCQTITENIAQQNINCLWFSYEVGMEEFFSKFSEVPLFYLPKTTKQNSLLWLEDRIVEAIAKFNCKAVFVDHLHYLLEMQKMAEAKSISLLIGMMMRELKRMAIKHQIIIFLVSHLRKTILDKLPEIDDMRDSSFVGQEADTVIFIKRLKDGDLMTNNATIKVAKNRRTGNLGLVKVQYINKKFSEITEIYEPAYI